MMFLSDPTLRIVMLGAGLLGVVSGAIGTFAVLRRQGLLGDAVSHAALPGLCAAFLMTQNKDTLTLVIGAAVAGWLGSLAVLAITGLTRIKEDAALAIVLSVFFGLGIVLLSMIQGMPNANQAGLGHFLFGSAATLLREDVLVLGVMSVLILSLTIVFWTQFKTVIFDRDFAHVTGVPVKGVSILLTTIIVLAIIIGLKTVGVVLMSAMLIAPAAAARQWTDRLSVMVALAAVMGALSGMGGVLLSDLAPNLPTGPVIVVVMTLLAFFSLLFSPHRGIVVEKIRARIHERRMASARLLESLFFLSANHADPFHPHEMRVLKALGAPVESAAVRELEARGFIRVVDRSQIALTPQGIGEGRRLGLGQSI